LAAPHLDEKGARISTRRSRSRNGHAVRRPKVDRAEQHRLRIRARDHHGRRRADPLVRVRAGTEVRVSVRNALTSRSGSEDFRIAPPAYWQRLADLEPPTTMVGEPRRGVFISFLALAR